MGDYRLLPEPYGMSFSVQEPRYRRNIFRPVQASELVTPGIGMIVPHVAWVGFAIHAFASGRYDASAWPPLYFDPEGGELYYNLLWTYGKKDQMPIGRQWACDNPTGWLFSPDIEDGKRLWPKKLVSFIERVLASDNVEEAAATADLLMNILGRRFKSWLREIGFPLETKIRENLIPQILGLKDSESSMEDIMIDGIRELVGFISELSHRIRVADEQEDIDTHWKIWSSDVTESVYGLRSFVEKVLGVRVEKAGIMEQKYPICRIVTRQSDPYIRQSEFTKFVDALWQNPRGRRLALTFVLLEYMSSREKVSLEQMVYDDTVLMNPVSRIERIGDEDFARFWIAEMPFRFREYEENLYSSLLRTANHWEFNFLLYYGEIIFREDRFRRRLLSRTGLSAGFIGRELALRKTLGGFFKYYFSRSHSGERLSSLREARDILCGIERDDDPEDRMRVFLNTLISTVHSQDPPEKALLRLLATNRMCERRGDSLKVKETLREEIDKVPGDAVFSGRDAVVNWLIQLKELTR